jgi:hypothetical protein
MCATSKYKDTSFWSSFILSAHNIQDNLTNNLQKYLFNLNTHFLISFLREEFNEITSNICVDANAREINSITLSSNSVFSSDEFHNSVILEINKSSII